MHTKEETLSRLNDLKAEVERTEKAYKAAVKARRTAVTDASDTLKEATRARMRYMRAMGFVEEEGNEGDETS